MSSFLDLAAFRLRFPEFKDQPDATVEARLLDARNDMDATTWGDSLALGHGFLTADLLRSSGHATDEAVETTYRRRYTALAKQVGAANRLIINDPWL